MKFTLSLAILSLTIAATSASAQNVEFGERSGDEMTFEAHGKAYMVLPAKLVVDGFLQNIIPSPDGRYIYAAVVAKEDSIFRAIATGNIPQDPTVQHILYDVKAGRKSVVAELPLESSPQFRAWLPDSSGLSFWIDEREEEADKNRPGWYILWLNETSIKVPEMDLTRRMGEIIKVGNTYVVKTWSTGPENVEDFRLQIYSADFSSVRTIALPNDSHPFVSAIPNQMAVYYRNNDGKFIGVNLNTGQTSEIQRPAPPEFVKPMFEVSATEKRPILIGGYGWASSQMPIDPAAPRQPSNPLKALSSMDYAVVSKESQTGGLLADNKYVWHVKERGLFLSEILEVDKAILDQQRSAAERTELLNRAKQVATGMMIYGADHDGQFPPINNWTSNLSPYVKNLEVMEGFVYMLGNKNRSDIEDPANTVLGYIDGKDGRAVAYANGSVKWEPRNVPLLLAEPRHIAFVLPKTITHAFPR